MTPVDALVGPLFLVKKETPLPIEKAGKNKKWNTAAVRAHQQYDVSSRKTPLVVAWIMAVVRVQPDLKTIKITAPSSLIKILLRAWNINEFSVDVHFDVVASGSGIFKLMIWDKY